MREKVSSTTGTVAWTQLSPSSRMMSAMNATQPTPAATPTALRGRKLSEGISGMPVAEPTAARVTGRPGL